MGIQHRAGRQLDIRHDDGGRLAVRWQQRRDDQGEDQRSGEGREGAPASTQSAPPDGELGTDPREHGPRLERTPAGPRDGAAGGG
ncbi:hypothetical protein GCM10009590_29660 [Brachybacterium alimentarium]